MGRKPKRLIIAKASTPRQEGLREESTGLKSHGGHWKYNGRAVARSWGPSRQMGNTFIFPPFLSYHFSLLTSTVPNLIRNQLMRELGKSGLLGSHPVIMDDGGKGMV